MKNKSFHDWRRVLTLALFVLLGSAYTWAQSIQVTGKVIDNLGEPMIGVSVIFLTGVSSSVSMIILY